jgi:hypothetical protein
MSELVLQETGTALPSVGGFGQPATVRLRRLTVESTAIGSLVNVVLMSAVWRDV